MKNQEITITFTPLSRNRFRCNQTGKIVKKAQTKRIGLQGGKTIRRTRSYSAYVGYFSSSVSCPACKRTVYIDRYDRYCTCSDGHRIQLVR